MGFPFRPRNNKGTNSEQTGNTRLGHIDLLSFQGFWFVSSPVLIRCHSQEVPLFSVGELIKHRIIQIRHVYLHTYIYIYIYILLVLRGAGELFGWVLSSPNMFILEEASKCGGCFRCSGAILLSCSNASLNPSLWLQNIFLLSQFPTKDSRSVALEQRRHIQSFGYLRRESLRSPRLLLEELDVAQMQHGESQSA